MSVTDLRYWSHLTRWCLDLLARGKFVPVVSADKKGRDRHLATAARQRRRSEPAKGILRSRPLICRSYLAPLPKKASPLRIDLPASADPMVRHFLETLVDAQVRRARARQWTARQCAAQ